MQPRFYLKQIYDSDLCSFGPVCEFDASSLPFTTAKYNYLDREWRDLCPQAT